MAPSAHARNIAALEENGSRSWFVQACKQPRDRALAASGLTDEGGYRPRMQFEGDIIDGVHVPAAKRAADRKALREVSYLERRGGGHRAPSSTRWQATEWPGSISRSNGRSP